MESRELSESVVKERLGAPLPAGEFVSVEKLADLKERVGKEFLLTGRVAAVCQHRGCWMELRGEDGGTARIRMAGHAFFVPKHAQGRQSRVWARVLMDPNANICEDSKKGDGCGAGKTGSLTALQLEALGVEIL